MPHALSVLAAAARGAAPGGALSVRGRGASWGAAMRSLALGSVVPGDPCGAPCVAGRCGKEHDPSHNFGAAVGFPRVT
jgi:hypothetical protein